MITVERPNWTLLSPITITNFSLFPKKTIETQELLLSFITPTINKETDLRVIERILLLNAETFYLMAP